MALNQSAINVEVVNGSAGGNVFTQALTVASTSTASFLKGIGALKSVTSTSLATISRIYTYAKSLLATSTSSVSIVKALSTFITVVNVISTATIDKAIT